jgi:DNA-binding transcriptional regulator YhcF (GntR family)
MQIVEEKEETAYDEWYELIIEAKKAGLTIEQLREFFGLPKK